MVECPSGKWLYFMFEFMFFWMTVNSFSFVFNNWSLCCQMSVKCFYTWLTGSFWLCVLDGALEVHCHSQVFCYSIYLWSIWHQFWNIKLSFFFWSVSLGWYMQGCCHIFLKPVCVRHVHGKVFCSLVPAWARTHFCPCIAITLIL